MGKVRAKVTKKKPAFKEHVSFQMGLNRSVSTYGRNSLRYVQNDDSWLQIQEQPFIKHGIFSDSEEGTPQFLHENRRKSQSSHSKSKDNHKMKRQSSTHCESPLLMKPASWISDKEKSAAGQSPKREVLHKNRAVENTSLNVINSSVQVPWLALNSSKAVFVNRARRQRKTDYKITDGTTTVSVSHAFPEANYTLESFQNSYICGHVTTDFNVDEALTNSCSDWSINPKHCPVQSTPLRRTGSPVLRIPLSDIRKKYDLQGGFLQFDSPLLLVKKKLKSQLTNTESSIVNHLNVSDIESTPLRRTGSPVLRLPLSDIRKKYDLQGGFLQFDSPLSLVKKKLKSQLINMEPSTVNHLNVSDIEELVSHSKSISAFADVLTSRDKVLQECKQSQPLPFEKVLFINKGCKKIGEGLYAEVFRLNASDDQVVAIKVVPIEGQAVVNEEKQKSFAEILPEIVSSSELSQLSFQQYHCTDCFIKLFRVHLICGVYPLRLLTAWDEYADEKTTENDRPDMFDDDQLYVVFVFDDGGTDLENFSFRNATQAITVLKQVVAGLAVAEAALMFEHRDLHWGNILVQECDSDEHVQCFINGTRHDIATNGIKVRIIDFTLSRMTKGGVTLFQDLASDETLFSGDAEVDYQFEVYRKMREETENDWSRFTPKTNVFWIHYLLDKMLHHVKYKNKRSKIHQRSMKTLKQLFNCVFDFNSCQDVFEHSNLFKT